MQNHVEKHPESLGIYFATEMWERYGFYVVQSLLALYLALHFKWPDKQIYALVGSFTALTYLSPVVGGWIADKLIGQKRAVLLGAIVLFISYCLLSSVDSVNVLTASLAGIAVGTGLLKPNISSLLGNEYLQGSARRESGFTIFYMGITSGIILGTTLPNILNEHFGWAASFTSAAIGMVIAFLVFSFGIKKYKIKDYNPFVFQFKKIVLAFLLIVFLWGLSFYILNSPKLANIVFGLVVLFSAGYISYAVSGENANQSRQTLVIGLLCIISVVFWSFYFQMFMSLTLFISRVVEPTFCGIQFPAPYYVTIQSIGMLIIGYFLANGASFMDANKSKRVIRANHGTEKQAQNWLAEAALRMLHNNLDPEVAENPDSLIVYGGLGKAARNWECFEKIEEVLKSLEANQTLLVQSGKPVGVFTTHEDAPRVLIANSNLVPLWATWDHFNELDKKGLMMYGQMTAGSWIYIGSQGIVQGTYETFVSAASKHYQGDFSGRWILTAGLGGMGGAQPLAGTMAGASVLAVECDLLRIEKRLKTRYLDRYTTDLDEALAWINESCVQKKPLSVAVLGNAAEVFPELVARGATPSLVTDQTSAHDPLNGYLPAGWTLEYAEKMRKTTPEEVVHAAKKSMATQVHAMLEFHKRGIPVFDYGNNIRQMALEAGEQHAFDFEGFVPAYIRPLFCEGIGPFRWVALSGDPEDIYATDEMVKKLIPDNKHVHRWLDMAKEKIAFQGLPARICWVGLKDRARLALAFNEMVKSGAVKAPIVIGRDHLDSGSVASPNRETEGMMDGSDAVSDWPLLNALLNCAGGATWVSIHHGGGVGMGFSQHAGVVIVADGTEKAAQRLARVLHNDPATGVMRHADAGYEIAKKCAKENGLWLPMVE